MRERTKRGLVLGVAVVCWLLATALTFAAVADADPWQSFLPLVTGGAVSATVARYLMRVRHIMAQIFRAGRDSEKEEAEQ